MADPPVDPTHEAAAARPGPPPPGPPPGPPAGSSAPDDDPAALDLSALLPPTVVAKSSGSGRSGPTKGSDLPDASGKGKYKAEPTIAEALKEPKVSRGTKWMVAVALAVPIGLMVVVMAAWAADSALAGTDTAPRGVTVSGVKVGAKSEAAVQDVVEELNAELATQPVVITTPKGNLETTMGDLGVTIDVEATTAAALAVGRDESLPQRPVDWLGGLVGDRPAPITYRVNQALVEFRLAGLLETNTVQPADPTIEATGDGWVVVPSTTGEVLDLDAATEALADQVGEVGTVEIALEPVTREPTFSDEDAEALAAEANRLTGTPITVQVEGQSAEVTPDVLRSFFEPVTDEEVLRMRVKQPRVQEWLAQTFVGLNVEPVDARFEIGFGVAVQPSVDGKVCCTEEAPRHLRAALEAGEPSVTLDMTVVEPHLTTEEANALGIVEPVASFTTNHAGGEGRVQNIHRFADLMTGAVIQPGETFSLNEHVGQRTEEKGFVEAGAIYAGVYVQDVGGGVSQFATTTFNAAFFAGLDFAEYQAHTIYISRYPYGREATISWPSPDLKLTNNSPYGFLIVPSYTDTSITVTLWSTKWVNADQTAQSERSIGGGCTRVTTERTRAFLDPAEAERIRGGPPDAGQPANEVKDDVFAIYQPGEGQLC